MSVIRFFGWLLMAMGGLIALTAGACTLIVGGQMIWASLQYAQGIPGSLFLILIFGGVPIMVGIGLFIAGRALARSGGGR
jgi:hypothetical protein